MMPWDNLCTPKGMGNLGFRDLKLFNIAMLGRQVWRLVNHKDSLCFKVLSAKYFPDGNIFHLKRAISHLTHGRASLLLRSPLKRALVGKLGIGNCAH